MLPLAPTFKSVRYNFSPEQVLTYFDISISPTNMCHCPFHNDDTASMQVNAAYVYCYGCGKSWDTYQLAKDIKEKTENTTYTAGDILEWFVLTPLPDKGERKYNKSEYRGEVPHDLVEYWHNMLTPEHYQTLYIERLLTPETIDKYKLGWRPDKAAWSIPFFTADWKGIDIVQFRHTTGEVKYTGLAGHNRGSIMNAYLLKKELPYLIVLFGAYDPILAVQDGLNVVGTSGSNAFGSKDYDRVKCMFSKQHNIFVVPDNTPEEIPAAHKFADMVGGMVRTFPDYIPEDMDYISYRRAGYTPQQFLQDVVGVMPTEDINTQLLKNLTEFIKHGNTQRMAEWHTRILGNGYLAGDIAKALALYIPWNNARKPLWGARSEEELVDAINDAHNILVGGW